MLFTVILLRKVLSIIAFIGLVAAAYMPQKTEKPDMQKIYAEAVNWSKAKLDQPDPANAYQTANIGVCRGANSGEPLMVKPPCFKKQQLHEVVDAVTDDHPSAVKDSDQPLEARSNPHQDILSSSKNQGPKILVFVSFSMPKASLKALAKEAAKHNAILVMRGLKGDSFKITQQAFLELAREDDKEKLDLITKAEDMQGFEVNPELFKTYQIKKVPTFVFVKDTKEISRLSGNVSLEYAANKLKENF